MNVVVLAAGMGKRMRSDLPKVLHRLAGRPLLVHVLDAARTLGAARLVVVHGHGGEQVREAATADDVTWALQSPQLGTGHAVTQALPFLDDTLPTLVLYGDVPLTRPGTLDRLVKAAGRDRLALLTVDLEDPTGYGRIVRAPGAAGDASAAPRLDIAGATSIGMGHGQALQVADEASDAAGVARRDARGPIRRIVEHKDAQPHERAIREVNTGILVAPTARLRTWLAALRNDNSQGEYYLTDIVAAAVADGVEVVSAQPDHAWETLGVNDRMQLAQLERVHQRNLAERLMADGVQLMDPARLDVRGTLACGRDVLIDVNCVFEGTVRLADGVRVGAHCVIRDADLGAGTEVLSFSHIEGAVVGAQARIGPYARLRPGTRLADEVHVGNFVETKAATLGAHSKANHLAYIGDARVGERVNIGAGTITCNYDGANKHLTVIEDDAFIGSDTQLVAPVTVGRGATLGAGTTLAKDAPAGALVITRAPARIVERWQRPTKKRK